MTRLFTAFTLSCFVAAASIMSAAGQTPAPGAKVDPKLGTNITIRGCLHEGTDADTYMLLNMTERPSADGDAENVITPAAPLSLAGRAPLPIYWLDSTKGLKERIGQIIDITGEVQEKNTKTGTITVSIDPSDYRSKEVTMTSGSKEVTSEKFRPVVAGAPPSTTVLPRQSYILAVRLVHSVVVSPAGSPCK